MDLNKNMEDFLFEQQHILEDYTKIQALMRQSDDLEDRSFQKWYERKDEFACFIEAGITLNEYDYTKFDFYFHIITQKDPDSRVFLLEILDHFQTMTFHLNVYLNTYVENCINYEMLQTLLPEVSLDAPARGLVEKLFDLPPSLKSKYIESHVAKLIGSKKYRSPFTQILISGFPYKTLPFYFQRSSGNFQKCQDFTTYLFFRDLINKDHQYLDQLENPSFDKIFDVFAIGASQAFLLDNNIEALKDFLINFLNILINYPLMGNQKNLARAQLAMFRIFYHPQEGLTINGKLPSKLGSQYVHIIPLAQDIASMVYLNTYAPKYEAFKSKHGLSDEEFELYKEFRFGALFLTGKKAYSLLIDKKMRALKQKCHSDPYFELIRGYGYSVSSVMSTFEDFQKNEIDRLLREVKQVDTSHLPDLYAYDVDYIQKDLERIHI